MSQLRESIEDAITRILQKGPLPTRELIRGVGVSLHGVTRQGVYRALRKLKAEEKVVTHSKSVSLNLLWLRQMGEFFSLAQHFYSPQSNNPEPFLNLGDKEKLSLSFKTLVDLDVFASHVIHLLAEVMPSGEPIYVYNPHEVFAYGRQEAEQLLLEVVVEMERDVYLLSSRETPLDTALKARFSGSNVQYHIEPGLLPDDSDFYFNVYGDFVLEIRVDSEVTEDIEQFYRTHTVFDAQAQERIGDIFSKRARHRVTISRNHAKAARFKKMFSKYF